MKTASKESNMNGNGNTICGDLGIHVHRPTGGRKKALHQALAGKIRQCRLTLMTVQTILRDRGLGSYLLLLLGSGCALLLIHLLRY